MARAGREPSTSCTSQASSLKASAFTDSATGPPQPIRGSRVTQPPHQRDPNSDRSSPMSLFFGLLARHQERHGRVATKLPLPSEYGSRNSRRHMWNLTSQDHTFRDHCSKMSTPDTGKQSHATAASTRPKLGSQLADEPILWTTCQTLRESWPGSH